MIKKEDFNLKTLSVTLFFVSMYLVIYSLDSNVSIVAILISIIPPFIILFSTIILQNKKLNKVTIKILLGLFIFFTVIYLIGIPISKLYSDTESYSFFITLFPLAALFFWILPLTFMSFIISKIINRKP